MSQYTYDEQGFNFYYFLISVLSLCLVPVTIQSLYSLFKSTSNYKIKEQTERLNFFSLASKNKDVCHCQTCEIERKITNSVKPSTIKKLLTSPK